MPRRYTEQIVITDEKAMKDKVVALHEEWGVSEAEIGRICLREALARVPKILRSRGVTPRSELVSL